MNCEYFNEIADSYLSDELAVETNHDVISHLENCVACRKELGKRRELRNRLRSSMRNAPEFLIDPEFAADMRSILKGGQSYQPWRLRWPIFVPVLATLFIFGVSGFIWLYQDGQNSPIVRLHVADVLLQQAVNRHTECGLKYLKRWETDIKDLSAEKVEFVKALQTDETEILEVHDCFFGNKRFTHYILRRDGKIFSVLRTKSDPGLTSDESFITSDREGGFQVASFQTKNETVFVISDMDETENLSLARTLFYSTQA
jgi:hypothetical protein